MIHTIGPVWDGNEVWLLVAGGATFAAFPEWYATLFSGFYLPLLRDPGRADRAQCGVSSSAASRDSSAWRNGWEWASS
jgi:cytochrome bd ubiquinol oxidase subunit II